MLDDLIRLSVNEDGIFLFLKTGRINILLNKQEGKSIKSASLAFSRTIFFFFFFTWSYDGVAKCGLD